MGKRYRQVQLNEDQMQCIANALALYFNHCTEQKIRHDPVFITHLQNAMEEFRRAMGSGVILPVDQN